MFASLVSFHTMHKLIAQEFRVATSLSFLFRIFLQLSSFTNYHRYWNTSQHIPKKNIRSFHMGPRLCHSVVVWNNCSDKKPHNLIDGQVFYSFSRFRCSAYITFYYMEGTLTRKIFFLPFEHNIHMIFSPPCNIL